MTQGEDPIDGTSARSGLRVDAFLGSLWGLSHADKCIFVAMNSLAFIGLYWLAARSLLARPAATPFHDPTAMHWFSRGALALVIAWIGLLATALGVRRTDPGNRALVHATVQLYTLGSCLLAWSIGVATSPSCMVLLGAILLGFFLFDRRSVFAGVAVGAVVLGALTALEATGRVAYAPLLARPPYDGAELLPWWKYAMLGIEVSSGLQLVVLFSALVRRLHERESRLESLARCDALTGVANRRHFVEALEREFRAARASGRNLACLLLDLDHFKAVNDTHGHLVGDRVLTLAAESLSRSIRAGDLVARYGGEEFAVLLPGVGLAQAGELAERCRKAIESSPLLAGGARVRVTASIGVAAMPHADVQRPEDLLRRADEALYRAKAAGRNRLSLAP